LSKLRNAVSKVRLTLLGQDIEPPKPVAEAVQAVPADGVARADLRGRKRRRARAVDPVGSHEPANDNGAVSTQAESGEPEAIRSARQRLRSMIAAATKGAPKPSVGIVLAIVNQETGNHAAANALIDEYGLERLFGITKFCPTS
jgi:hypothetical protein